MLPKKFELVNSELRGSVDPDQGTVTIEPTDRIRGFGVAMELAEAIEFAKMVWRWTPIFSLSLTSGMQRSGKPTTPGATRVWRRTCTKRVAACPPGRLSESIIERVTIMRDALIEIKSFGSSVTVEIYEDPDFLHRYRQRRQYDNVTRSSLIRVQRIQQERMFTAINNDTVIETMGMADNSIDEIVTSIPFGNHYEYT